MPSIQYRWHFFVLSFKIYNISIVYTNIINFKSLFVYLNVLILGTNGSNLKILFALDSPFTEFTVSSN